jgi:hypothetical protein
LPGIWTEKDSPVYMTWKQFRCKSVTSNRIATDESNPTTSAWCNHPDTHGVITTRPHPRPKSIVQWC